MSIWKLKMTNFITSPVSPLGWKKSCGWLALAVACFQAAYASLEFPAAGLLIFGYAFALVQLTNQPNVRRAFYFGLGTGILSYTPQLFFLWHIFSAAAIVLWLVLAFWIGLFTAIVCGCIRRWGKARAAWLIPFVWTGIEYCRSELYYLKFSWLNVGYAFPNFPAAPLVVFGMYGVGFIVFSVATAFAYGKLCKSRRVLLLGFAFLLLLPLAWHFQRDAAMQIDAITARQKPLALVGVQMEFPAENVIPKMLDKALAKSTDAPIFVLSEYTLDGAVPDALKKWCRKHSRFLVIGGKDFVTNDVYYNTAFVIGTNGNIIFKQVKSVPIQFFRDGLPAPNQDVWNSPWGKIGICVCYDLSYTRVTDELVRQGAQLLIVPTMDVEYWGRHQHELHARVAPVRAAEYGIPIFRLCSSGISQAVTGGGTVVAQAPWPGNGDIMAARLRLATRGALPLDRYLAPLCTGLTSIITSVLLFLAWKNRTKKPPNQE